MGIKPAVELSYLNKDEQELVYAGITYNDLTPRHGQAIKIRELSKNKQLDYDSLEEILTQNKGNQNEQISFNKEKIQEWKKLGVPVTMYGVGTSFVNNMTCGFTGDLVMLDGKHEAKEGRANYPSDRLKKVPYPIY